jgi:hypothetical protein
VEDLTHYLYSNNMSKYIELYVQKVESPPVTFARLRTRRRTATAIRKATANPRTP